MTLQQAAEKAKRTKDPKLAMKILNRVAAMPGAKELMMDIEDRGFLYPIDVAAEAYSEYAEFLEKYPKYENLRKKAKSLAHDLFVLSDKYNRQD